MKYTELKKLEQIIEIFNNNNANTDLLFADITSQNISKLLI